MTAADFGRLRRARPPSLDTANVPPKLAAREAEANRITVMFAAVERVFVVGTDQRITEACRNDSFTLDHGPPKSALDGDTIM